MDILLILLMSILNIGCFFIGLDIGRKLKHEQKVELPKLPNPMEKVRQAKEEKKVNKELERISTILYNAEIYDGTSNGQRDIE